MGPEWVRIRNILQVSIPVNYFYDDSFWYTLTKLMNIIEVATLFSHDELRMSAANFGFGLKSFNFLNLGLVLHTLSPKVKAIEMVA